MIEITEVEKGSPAERAGVLCGDALVAVNGLVIHDVLDYQYAITEKKLEITVSRNGTEQTVTLTKGEYEDPGLYFPSALMDKKQTCGNHCIFCFIDQNPKGMRKSIYFKDDDARLSFLHGSYITLTNLTDADVDRIIKMHLTVNVSVHTTEPDLRCRMLGNKKAGDALRHLYRMAEHGIQMDCQIVLCPGLNDGDALHCTLADLFKLVPAVTSIAVVPVGLTKHRTHLCKLQAFTPETAKAAIEQIEAVQRWSLAEHGSRIVYASDELYLLAGLPLPSADAYEDYPQYENGVGMLRSILDEFADALADAEYHGEAHTLTVATGTAAAPFFAQMMNDLHAKFPQITVNVIAIRNDFYGESVTVAGLLTGLDILAQLKDKNLGEAVLLSEACLRYDDAFLDDMTREQLSGALGVPVVRTAIDGYTLLDTILGGNYDSAC